MATDKQKAEKLDKVKKAIDDEINILKNQEGEEGIPLSFEEQKILDTLNWIKKKAE